MRKLEIQAYSINEAKIKAYQQGITVVSNITNYWKKCGSPIFEKDIQICATDYMLDKGMFDFEGAGVIITIQNGTKNKRLKPYKITKFKRGSRCKTKKLVEIRRVDNDEVIGEASCKSEGVELAKELIQKHQTNLYGKLVYRASHNDKLFTAEYIPSKDTKPGQYVVFGVDQADVRLSKRKNRGFE